MRRSITGLVGALALGGCLSSAELRAQPAQAVRVYQGTPDAVAACVLAGETQFRTAKNLVKIEKSAVYVPGELVEIESNYYDHFGAIRYPMVTWTLRRAAPDAVRVELRVRGRLTEDPAGQERSFELVSKCAGPRRPELE